MPLLEKTKAAGEDAKVLTVLSAGVEPAPVDLDDLGLKKTFTLVKCAQTTSVYNDCLVQVRSLSSLRF